MESQTNSSHDSEDSRLIRECLWEMVDAMVSETLKVHRTGKVGRLKNIVLQLVHSWHSNALIELS